MYFCDNYALAVLLCVVTMFCWGSWGNTQKLAGKTWRYELFYWDYVIGILLFSVAMGLTMGSCGDKTAWGFAANLKSSFGAGWLWPFLSGVIFNASNILLAAAIAVAGMSVAFPVGVGLALVGGTLLNFAVKRQGSPVLIGLGLLLIVVSILCNAMAFKVKQGAGGGISDSSSAKKGLILAALAGFLMMWFSPLVNRAVDLAFTTDAPRPGMLTPYTGFFLFAVGVFISNFVFNTVAMRKPVQGEPIRDGMKRYFGGSPKTHLVGVLGGCIWGLGTLLSFVSAGKAGPAVSYALGQGATLVSALWGILVWKEFAGAPRKSTLLNRAMFILFVLGLGALVVAGDSGQERKAKRSAAATVEGRGARLSRSATVTAENSSSCAQSVSDVRLESGFYFALIHNTFDFKSNHAYQFRSPPYLIAGRFNPAAKDQPVEFSEPKMFASRDRHGNSFYSSYTVYRGVAFFGSTT